MGEEGERVIAQWTLPAELTSDDVGPAAELVSTYFHKPLEDGRPYYSGARFETFAGGGDALQVANTFTPADLVAVSLLSVGVPGQAALQILETRSAELNGLLGRIPNGRELRHATDEEIGPGSAADDLWRALRECRGVGPVTTSKLLARKRPALLPVTDAVVKKVLSHPRRASFWLTLRAQLNADDGLLHERLVKIRNEARVGEFVSVIRCFDVVTWMIGKRDGA